MDGKKEGNRKSIGSLVSDLPSEIPNIDYSQALKGIENLPKIILNDARRSIIAEDYEGAEKTLRDYEIISKVAEERGFHYAVNGPLKNNYDKQREILENLKQNNFFYNNSGNGKSYE